MGATEVAQVTDENILDALGATDRPVVVEFWAEGCQPCRSLAAVLAECATRLDGVADLIAADLMLTIDAAASFGVMSVPALYICVDGSVVREVQLPITADALELEVRAVAGGRPEARSQ